MDAASRNKGSLIMDSLKYTLFSLYDIDKLNGVLQSSHLTITAIMNFN